MGIVEKRMGILVLYVAPLYGVGIEFCLPNGSKFAIEVNWMFFIDEAVVRDKFIRSG